MLIDFIDLDDKEIKDDMYRRAYSLVRVRQGVYATGEATLTEDYVIDDISDKYVAIRAESNDVGANNAVLRKLEKEYAEKEGNYVILERQADAFTVKKSIAAVQNLPDDIMFVYGVFQLKEKPGFEHIIKRYIPDWMKGYEQTG